MIARLPTLPRPLRLAAALAFLVIYSSIACSKVPLLAPSGASITLTAAATALSIGGSTDLTVQVLESAGTPPQDGTLVTFITTLGSIQPSEARTTGGRVVVKFLAGASSGTATITATSGGAGAANNANQAKIAIGSAAAASVSVTANPGTIIGVSGNSTITAAVLDSSGNPLAGVPVTFSTDGNGTLVPPVANTNASGQAQTVLTTSKTAKITATAGVSATSGTTTTTAPSGSVTVTVSPIIPPTVSISFTGTPTVGSPTSFTVIGTEPTGATTFVQDITLDWGDGSLKVSIGGGTPAAGTTVQHTYQSPGEFKATVVATDNTGVASTASVVVNIAPQQPLSVAMTQTGAGAHPATVLITATVSPTLPAGASFAWDFGDTTTATTTGLSVTHVFGAAGTYTIKVSVTAPNGQTGSSQIQIVVT